MYEARISWPTAKQVWDGDLSKTRLDTARKLAAALGCPIGDLFDYTDEETEPA
jgi:DNA-binding Xre family transcriptional regulator